MGATDRSPPGSCRDREKVLVVAPLKEIWEEPERLPGLRFRPRSPHLQGRAPQRKEK